MARDIWSSHAAQLQIAGHRISSGSDIWSYCLRAGLLRSGFALFCDIDNFSTINERHGRQAGDDILKNAWHRLLMALPSTAFAIRWSGNGFLLLLDVTDEALGVFVRANLAPLQIGNRRLCWSAGCARVGMPSTLEDCFRVSMHADSALNLAKKRGGNLTLLFEGSGEYSVVYCGQPCRPVYTAFDRKPFLQ